MESSSIVGKYFSAFVCVSNGFLDVSHSVSDKRQGLHSKSYTAYGG